MNSIIIDVREKDEFDAEHVENSISIPLSDFQRTGPAILRNLKGQSIQIMCRSGKRAQLAHQMIQAFDLPSLEVQVYEGGILQWKNHQKPTLAYKKHHLPIMRQVQLGAGGMVLFSALMGYWVNPNWIFLGAFVGTGLLVAGATGFCGMAELLARMPWNQSSPTLKKELCEVSSASKACQS